MKGGNNVSEQAPPKPKDTNSNYANAAKSGAHLPDPARSVKKRVAAIERESLMYKFTNTRALQTFSFLRPLNASGVGKYFVSAGWICNEELALAVSEEATARFEEKNQNSCSALLVCVLKTLMVLIWNNNEFFCQTFIYCMYNYNLVHSLFVSLFLCNANGLHASSCRIFLGLINNT